MNDRLILVGLPLYQGYIHYDCVISVQNMMEECASHGYILQPYYAKGPSLPIKRRQCIDKAREVGAKWVMMIDSDMIVTNPKWLWIMLNRRKRIISGTYYAKQEPWVALLSRYKDRDYRPSQDETIEFWMNEVQYEQSFSLPKDSVVEVDAVGGGFVLIETACFDGMKDPYFLMTDYHGLGEDYFMCHRLRQLGHKIYVDTSIQLQHIGDYNYSQKDNRLGQVMLQMKQKEANGNSEVCGKLSVAPGVSQAVETGTQ